MKVLPLVVLKHGSAGRFLALTLRKIGNPEQKSAPRPLKRA